MKVGMEGMAGANHSWQKVSFFSPGKHGRTGGSKERVK